jgi:hypothetical protein
MSPAELQAVVARCSAWADDLGRQGTLRGGETLRDDGGRALRREHGAMVVQDGPYAELREIISGCFLLEAKDCDEAVALASTCPHVDSRGSMMLPDIEKTSAGG